MKPLGTYKLPIGAEDCGSGKCGSGLCVRCGKRYGRKGIKVLSLFDGISCARIALKKAKIPVETYYASEIDKYAIQISKKNYPDIEQLGDIKGIQPMEDGVIGIKSDLTNREIDLMIGGSPCQDLSIAKANRKGLDGERSGLFWEYVRLLREIKPKYFILENVASMPKKDQDIITKELGVEPIMINASLVSAQNRKRLFWVGKLGGSIDNVYGKYFKVEVPLPEDKGIMLKDILLDGTTEDLKSLCITATYASKNRQDYEKKRMGQMIKVGQIGSGGQGQRVYSPNGDVLRKLHPIECERLQGLPDNYTERVSNTQRYKACGNAFNVDVVAHIIKHLVL